MIGANALFIAAHARASGLELLTNNTAEFERVSGRKLVNLTQPGAATADSVSAPVGSNTSGRARTSRRS
jgi:hypothetical protein